MPVDKFGHTDVGSSQRVIAGGVTLSQINESFLRLDGANPVTGNLKMGGHKIKGLPTTNTSTAGMDEALSRGQAIDLITNHNDSPSNDNHLTNKKYVDEQVTLKVSKTGDTMTGDLFLSNGRDLTRAMGCKDLDGNKDFNIYLGNTTNKIEGRINQPIILQSTTGFRFRVNNEAMLEMVGTLPSKINVYKPISMHSAHITGLRDPSGPSDAATKKYVDMTAVGPAFSIYSLTRQAINAVTHTIVTFDRVRFKSDSVSSMRLTRFTPGKAGYYIVSAYIEFCSSNTAHGNVYLYKNGTLYMQISGGGGTGGSHNNSTGSTIVFVTNTDYFEIFVFSQIGLSILARDFSVAFLRP